MTGRGETASFADVMLSLRDKMELALDEARQAAKAGEVPVGAVLFDRRDGSVLAVAHNRVERDHDPTAHAEMLAIRSAAKRLGSKRLIDAELFVTLEPCPMCAQAISFARLARVVFGAYDPKAGGVEHGPRIFDQPGCNHRPDIVAGVQESQCGLLLKDFFQARR
ncbi:tRNA(Arg) A34 adenosine deaminase TadA [Limibacillus halophilus]|uniref:tRNA-specific adenosine deaminase n=2 Tax=Limibacillus halophilus TaxID=1579333 RepID=A0A839SR29_9PROT|nr:tRNA(Arg) A34 adenosine deaminase TadA [Limibacillus halophilus]